MSSIYEILLKKSISKDDKLKELNRNLGKVVLELDLLKNKTEKPEYESKAPNNAKKVDRYVYVKNILIKLIFFSINFVIDPAYLLY